MAMVHLADDLTPAMANKRARGSRGVLLAPTFALLLAWGWFRTARTLDEIINNAMAATCGRETILRIETLRRTGNLSQRGGNHE